MSRIKTRMINGHQVQVHKDIRTEADLTISRKVSKINAIPKVFWCYDITLHKRDPNYAGNATCCLTHLVGLPRHPATNTELPLTDYQVEFAEAIIDIVKFNRVILEQDKQLGKYILPRHKSVEDILMYHLNKGRQMGFTEIVLRLIQFFCLVIYLPGRVIVITGTNIKTTKKTMGRFKGLFYHIPYTVSKNTDILVIELVTNLIVEGLASSEDAIVGDTKIRAIFMDESAKWRVLDDTQVFSAIIPIVKSNKSHFFVISTPKGPVKTFYKISKNPNTDFLRIEYDIWYTKGNLYTEEEIQDMIQSSEGDPNQEYLCQYTIGEDSIFGLVQKEDKQKLTLWSVKKPDRTKVKKWK